MTWVKVKARFMNLNYKKATNNYLHALSLVKFAGLQWLESSISTSPVEISVTSTENFPMIPINRKNQLKC